VTSWIALRRRCTLTLLVACLAIPGLGRAAAEDHLYPHAERQSGPWGYIDKTGRVVIPLQYQQAQPFSEGLAAVRKDDKFGFIDRTGRVVIDFQFGWVQPFQDGRSVVSTGHVGGRTTWAIIDPDGRITAVPNAQSIRPFREGRAVITISDIGNKQKAGVIDPSGRLVIGPEYDQILSFSEGLAAGRRNGKWGFIDKDGAVVIRSNIPLSRVFPKGAPRCSNSARRSLRALSTGAEGSSLHSILSRPMSSGMVSQQFAFAERRQDRAGA
jgi:WG containing repeat